MSDQGGRCEAPPTGNLVVCRAHAQQLGTTQAVGIDRQAAWNPLPQMVRRSMDANLLLHLDYQPGVVACVATPVTTWELKTSTRRSPTSGSDTRRGRAAVGCSSGRAPSGAAVRFGLENFDAHEAEVVMDKLTAPRASGSRAPVRHKNPWISRPR